jgi:hypothetical protein
VCFDFWGILGFFLIKNTKLVLKVQKFLCSTLQEKRKHGKMKARKIFKKNQKWAHIERSV